MVCKNVCLCTDQACTARTHALGVLTLAGFKALIGNSGYSPDQIRTLLASNACYDLPVYREAAQPFIDARTAMNGERESKSSTSHRLTLVSTVLPEQRPEPHLKLVANPTRLQLA